METQFQQEFQFKWEKYFPSAKLPVAYFYTDKVTAGERADSQDQEHCVVASFQRVRQGHTFVYGEDSPGCKGWRRLPDSPNLCVRNLNSSYPVAFQGRLRASAIRSRRTWLPAT